MKVFIVEDEADARVFLERRLHKEGFTVLSASNGVEALETLQKTIPDIVISDIMMPEMDGFELCRRMKADDDLKAIPFLFYTATFLDSRDEQLAMALGGEKFIAKPIDFEQLLGIIHEVLEKHKKETGTNGQPAKSEEELAEMYSESIGRKLDKKIKELGKEHEALVRSEKKYRRLVEGLKDEYFFYAHDNQGVFTYLSPSIYNVLGYNPDEFMIHYTDSLTDNPINKEVEHYTKLCMTGVRQPPYEIEVYHKDGSIRSLELKESPVFGAHGEVTAIEGIAHDITDRKQSELRYMTLFNNAPDTIFTLGGSELTIKEFNKQALDTFRCKDGDFAGKTPFDISPTRQPDGKDSKEKAFQITEGVLKRQQPLTFEWQHQRFDGEIFDTEVSLGILAQEPEVVFHAIVRDTSERKRLDRQIRLLQHWVEHSVDFFFWVREDAQVLYVNKAVCNALGYSFEELCSMKVGEFDLELPIEAWPAFTQKLREQGSYSFESRLRKKNGQIFPVEITANILKFEDKDHYFAYGRDISAKVQADEDHKKLESQLRQAQKMEAIGTLAGGIAHDFNNILSAIFGYTELARLDSDNPERLQKDMQEVLSAAERAKELVMQILTFSRKTEQELKPLSVQVVIKEALKLLRSSISTTINIEQDIYPDCEAVLADPTQIHQVIMNLCTNAYHAMRKTGGVLNVSLRPIELPSENQARETTLRPGNYLELQVSDTGLGIPRENLERIFEPYFTTKEKGEGTGLGLAVVHGIVKTFRGDILVESEPGKGTTFHIYLPVIEESKYACEEDLETPLITTGSERILFVDDDESIVECSKQMLESYGYKVTALMSSKEALDEFQKHPDAFDLIITDMNMPNMNGAELSKKILAGQPEMPIILCTGYSDLIDAEKAKSIGISEHLMKPLIWADLAKTIRNVIDAS